MVKNLCFFGESGAGKTTAADIAVKLLMPHYSVIRCDVATPLREIQNFCRKTFDLPNSGNPRKPANFTSDGELLSFLAQHFEPYLAPTFVKRYNEHMDLFLSVQARRESSGSPQNTCGKPVFINADCRNNSYDLLKKLGFTFIKVCTPPEIRRSRTQQRDLTPFASNPAELISNIEPTYCLNNETTKLAFEEHIKLLLIRMELIKD